MLESYIRPVLDEPVGGALELRHDGEEAAEEVRDEDEDEEGGAQPDGGAVGLEPLLLLQLVEPVHELDGADELEHADELEAAQEVGGRGAARGVAVVGEGGGDDLVEGEAPGEVGEEPGEEVVARDGAEVADDVPVAVAARHEGEDDVEHEDAVDEEVEELDGRQAPVAGALDAVIEGDAVWDGETAVEEE